ncbi:MAG: DUF2283 domain-containing protein [Candidatus Eremiobacteraeota bacterium]|nr:DUF2283 domain-containing protein [Candidatus Eremiobacteraeota bacterium]
MIHPNSEGNPTSIRIDLEAGAGYIYYSNGEGRSARTVDVWKDGQVAADYDESGKLVGIEVLGFDLETLSHARRFAREAGLSFPVHLEGVLPA